MSLFLSIEPIFYVILFVLSVCSFTLAAPSKISAVVDVPQDSYYNYHTHQIVEIGNIDGGPEKTRVKRNGGSPAGKYGDTASMGGWRMVQMFFTLIRNFINPEPIGGNHPLSPTIPKLTVELLKNKIYAKFLPDFERDQKTH